MFPAATTIEGRDLPRGDLRILTTMPPHNMDAYGRRFGVSGDRPYPPMDLGTPELGLVDLADYDVIGQPLRKNEVKFA